MNQLATRSKSLLISFARIALKEASSGYQRHKGSCVVSPVLFCCRIWYPALWIVTQHVAVCWEAYGKADFAELRMWYLTLQYKLGTKFSRTPTAPSLYELRDLIL